jgi:catechol 2,3-dioxygenase-like lactoylglutathione lyase family enzyme
MAYSQRFAPVTQGHDRKGERFFASLLARRLKAVYARTTGEHRMANLIGPDFITLLVRDLDVSHHFYANIIGLRESSEKQPNAFAFATQPCGFAIRRSPDATHDIASSTEQRIILWFRTDDAALLHANLRDRGVPIAKDLADSPFGKTFTFRDPDGYLVTVHDRA